MRTFRRAAAGSFSKCLIRALRPHCPICPGGARRSIVRPLSGPTLELIQGGRIKAIALASDKRSPFLPDVPTINESVKLKNFEHSIWSGIFASADTPEPIITRLNAAMQEWIVSAENQDRLAKERRTADGGAGRAAVRGVF